MLANGSKNQFGRVTEKEAQKGIKKLILVSRLRSIVMDTELAVFNESIRQTFIHSLLHFFALKRQYFNLDVHQNEVYQKHQIQ